MEKNITVLIKPSSNKCNLLCKYCFYNDVSKYRQIQFKGYMSEKTMNNLIEKAFSYANESINFAFQGGEPTLIGLTFFQNFVNKVNFENQKHHLKIDYSIQTNGILINDEWCKFLYKNNFLVGLSYDGKNIIQDKYRLFKNGEKTSTLIAKTLDLFNKYNIQYNLLCVISKDVAKNGKEIYYSLKNKSQGYIQFIPCLSPLDNQTSEYSLNNDDYYNFINDTFLCYYQDIKNKDYTSVRYFDNLIFVEQNIFAEQCGMSGKCSIQFVIEGDGSVYPCDFYCLDELCLGNINNQSFSDLENSNIAKEFIKPRIIDNGCSSCIAKRFCNNGCKRYSKNNKYLYCEALQKFINNNYSKIKEIVNIIKTY